MPPAVKPDCRKYLGFFPSHGIARLPQSGQPFSQPRAACQMLVSPGSPSYPQMQPAVEHVGQGLGDALADLIRMVAGAEMAGDDQLVAELLARSRKSSRCMWPNLWILSLRCRGATNVISMMSTSAWNMAGQASSPAGELSPR